MGEGIADWLINNIFKIQSIPISSILSCAYELDIYKSCLLYTSPSPRDRTRSRMPSSA